jgi:iron complex outermembrane recepter protein
MRTKQCYVMVLVLVLVGWSGILSAAPQDEAVMSEVVVTASRQAEQTVKVPADVTVVTAEDIEDSTAQNVAELLQTQAGIHVMDTGGNQRNYYVDLRGFGESSPQNVLLLVDGRRINLPDLSGPDWNLIPLDHIARIEVIRGGRGTVLYGDNASGGVINIITKEGGKTEGTLTAKYGSYDTFKGDAAVSGTRGMAAYDISTSYLYAGGYRDHSESIAKDVGANVRLDPSDTVELSLSAGYHYDDTNNPGGILQSQFDSGADRTDTFTPDDFSRVYDHYLKAGLEIDMLSNDTFKLDTSFRTRDKTLFGSSPAYWFNADTHTGMVSIAPQFIFREDFGEGISNRITLGVDYNQDRQDYDNHSEYLGFPGQIVATLKKENGAYYLHDELGITRQLSLSGGYRGDRVTFRYRPASPTEKRTFDEDGYDCGINYAFGPNSHVYGSYTHTFRYPVLDEQFYYYNSSVDTTIQPQTSDQYEAGVSAEVIGGLVLTMDLFRSETKNEIFFNFYSGSNENMDATTIRQGAELRAAWHYRNFFLGGSFTHTDVDIDGGQFDGKDFPFVPQSKATAKASYTFGSGLYLGMDATYVGERVLISDFNNDYDKEDSYTVVNAKIQYPWRNLTFFADLNNIFNEEYSAFSALGYNSLFEVEPGFYPSPEFNVLVGVSVKFSAI